MTYEDAKHKVATDKGFESFWHLLKRFPNSHPRWYRDAAEMYAESLKEKKEEKVSGVDMNNLRMQLAFSLDNVTKTLNSGIYATGGYVEVLGNYVNCREVVVVDVEDLQEDMISLQSQVWALLCCMDGDNPDFRSVYEDVEKNGGLCEFNPERE